MIIPLNNAISCSRLDDDASQFVETCGITNSVTVRTINDCFKQLKGSGIWDCIYYGFAMIYAGTTQSLLIDIKSRQSLSVSIPISGVTSSPTYSSTGIQYNNGEFHYIGGTPLNNIINSDAAPGHISILNRTNYSLMGYTFSSKHGFREVFSTYEHSIGFGPDGVSASLWNASGPMSFTLSNTSGFFIFSNANDNGGFTASSLNPYKFYLSRNGIIVGSQSSHKNFHTYGSDILIGAFSDNLSQPIVRSFDEICWYSIGSGFTNSSTGKQIDIEKQELFYRIVLKLQTSLNR